VCDYVCVGVSEVCCVDESGSDGVGIRGSVMCLSCGVVYSTDEKIYIVNDGVS
jgi:hypothetical protein